ncbi:hypothetical protein APA_5237 [Pseudanabaena sp. lw0831]|nr:hypothetical protein APA_5237 [Pseudanabaena sp. lw0831]
MICCFVVTVIGLSPWSFMQYSTHKILSVVGYAIAVLQL